MGQMAEDSTSQDPRRYSSLEEDIADAHFGWLQQLFDDSTAIQPFLCGMYVNNKR